MATGNSNMLNDALSQWALECNAMINYGTNLFYHIPDWDNNPWATGHGWMLAGFVRVVSGPRSGLLQYARSRSLLAGWLNAQVASINSAGQSASFSSTINTYSITVSNVFTALFNQLTARPSFSEPSLAYLQGSNLIPDYMLGSGDGTGDTSGTAATVSAYYRFRVLAPSHTNAWMDSKASAMFDAVVSNLSDQGWLGGVVNPQYPWAVSGYSGQSPEGQSFLGLMWAARTAAGV